MKIIEEEEAALKMGVDGLTALSCIVLPTETKDRNPNSVIDSYERAEKLCTAEYLYKRNRILERQSEVQGETINYAEQNKCSSEDFEKLTKGEKDLWEAAARAQVLR